MPFKVVVLGGGVSGLMAARQLSYFGLDVTVIEARVWQLATNVTVHLRDKRRNRTVSVANLIVCAYQAVKFSHFGVGLKHYPILIGKHSSNFIVAIIV
jgi:NADH dehydrogenase FAD-containing subunit